MDNKSTIMVVDDDDQVRTTLCENLEECGFEVLQARDGQEAMNHLEQGKRPLVVITDLIMPRKEGLEVILDIRRLHPGIRVVAMSGGRRSKAADFLQMAARLGADAIMPKPVDISELEKTVRNLMTEEIAAKEIGA